MTKKLMKIASDLSVLTEYDCVYVDLMKDNIEETRSVCTQVSSFVCAAVTSRLHLTVSR